MGKPRARAGCISIAQLVDSDQVHSNTPVSLDDMIVPQIQQVLQTLVVLHQLTRGQVVVGKQALPLTSVNSDQSCLYGGDGCSFGTSENDEGSESQFFL